jgi:hypothetical protein
MRPALILTACSDRTAVGMGVAQPLGVSGRRSRLDLYYGHIRTATESQPSRQGVFGSF